MLRKYSDLELLGKLLGVREAKKIYAGSLNAVFKDQAPEICLIARELLTRWLNEEIKTGASMNAPQAVRDYLKMHFAGREYESFVAIFLDAQHHVIAVEELFRGTLTQTSVYPREVVKASLKHNCGRCDYWRIMWRTTKCALCAPIFYVPEGSLFGVD